VAGGRRHRRGRRALGCRRGRAGRRRRHRRGPGAHRDAGSS
jgi:hypothetical protein